MTWNPMPRAVAETQIQQIEQVKSVLLDWTATDPDEDADDGRLELVMAITGLNLAARKLNKMLTDRGDD